MGFKFKRKESVQKGVKRITKRRIRKAVGSLKDGDRLDSVHDVRKDIKELRALLRLVRAGLPKSVYQRCSSCLRRAARCLGAARDAHVKVSALAKLMKNGKQELASGSFGTVNEVLAQASRKQQEELNQRHVRRRVCRLLRSVSREVSKLRLKESGWSAVGPGIERTYRAGRRNYGLAAETGTAENFHAWRKRVKDLFYQTGLLYSIWPEQMREMEAELKRLGGFLGDDHDLTMLVEPSTVKQFEGGAAAQDLGELRHVIEKRQKELRGEALAIGKSFYGEKPGVFCERMEQYWKRWRRGSKRRARAR